MKIANELKYLILPSKKIRDPAQGDIALTTLEMKIIDTNLINRYVKDRKTTDKYTIFNLRSFS